MSAGAIYLGDFDTVESKVLAEKEIFNKIAPKVGSWAYRSYKKTLLPPYRTATFRTIVFPDAPDPTAAVLVEGVKPDPTGSLTIVERTMFTKPYGFYETYSDELANFSFDNLVPRLVEGVALKARLFVDKIAAEAWKGGNQVYEVAEGGLTREIISKIRCKVF